MECEIKKDQGALRVGLSGDMDRESVVGWKKVRTAFQETPKDLAIDCAGVRLITSTALSGLLRLKQFVEQEGKKVAFQGLSDHAREMFMTAGLLRAGEGEASRASKSEDPVSQEEFPIRRVASSRSSPDEMLAKSSVSSSRTESIALEEPQEAAPEPAMDAPEEGESPDMVLEEWDAYHRKMKERLESLLEIQKRHTQTEQELHSARKELDDARKQLDQAQEQTQQAERKAKQFEEKLRDIKKLMDV